MDDAFREQPVFLIGTSVAEPAFCTVYRGALLSQSDFFRSSIDFRRAKTQRRVDGSGCGSHRSANHFAGINCARRVTSSLFHSGSFPTLVTNTICTLRALPAKTAYI